MKTFRFALQLNVSWDGLVSQPECFSSYNIMWVTTLVRIQYTVHTYKNINEKSKCVLSVIFLFFVQSFTASSRWRRRPSEWWVWLVGSWDKGWHDDDCAGRSGTHCRGASCGNKEWWYEIAQRFFSNNYLVVISSFHVYNFFFLKIFLLFDSGMLIFSP